MISAAARQPHRKRRRWTISGSTASTNRPMPGMSSRLRLWFARAIPKTIAAATRLRSARWSRPSRAAADRRRSQSTSRPSRMATRARWRAWTSARLAICQAIGVVARIRPAASPTQRRPVSRMTRRTVAPAATPPRIADRRFIRNAGSPNGWSTTEANQPRMTQAGKPVGWPVPRIGSDRLELAGVPQVEPRQERPEGQDEGHGRRQQGGRQRGEPGGRLTGPGPPPGQHGPPAAAHQPSR